MTVSSHSTEPAQSRMENVLPQYGFSAETSFSSLVAHNPFLFRVYTPRPPVPSFAEDDEDHPYFVAQKFQDRSPLIAKTPSTPTGLDGTRVPKSSYADAIKHMDWTTKSSSPYVTASFSFGWAIWEAVKRYKFSMKHGVEIAVIDARVVADRAVTALELLRNSKTKERHRDHWKYYRFALESQDVLVYSHIPTSAILASIPLPAVLPNLPSYFLHLHELSPKSTDLFQRLAWDPLQRRNGFRQFCRDLSQRFLDMSLEGRLEDSTTGASRLAVCLLRPWFHEKAVEETELAVDMAARLALIIASWPGLWWVREHAEVPELVRSIISLLAEEVREARKGKVMKEVVRLQEIVDDLEWLAKEESEPELESSRTVRFAPEIMLEQPDKSDPDSCPEPSSSPDLSCVQGNVNVGREEPMDPLPPSPDPTTLMRSLSESDLSPPLGSKAPGASSSSYSLATTASSAVTGFLFGTLAALCIMAPPRRELLTHLT